MTKLIVYPPYQWQWNDGTTVSQKWFFNILVEPNTGILNPLVTYGPYNSKQAAITAGAMVDSLNLYFSARYTTITESRLLYLLDSV